MACTLYSIFSPMRICHFASIYQNLIQNIQINKQKQFQSIKVYKIRNSKEKVIIDFDLFILEFITLLFYIYYCSFIVTINFIQYIIQFIAHQSRPLRNIYCFPSVYFNKFCKFSNFSASQMALWIYIKTTY